MLTAVKIVAINTKFYVFIKLYFATIPCIHLDERVVIGFWIFTSSCSGCLVEDIPLSFFFFSLEREERYGIFHSVRKNISKL